MDCLLLINFVYMGGWDENADIFYNQIDEAEISLISGIFERYFVTLNLLFFSLSERLMDAG